MQLGKFPWLFYFTYRLMGKKQELAASKDTQIVIEGFPRSGNSFAVLAFEFAQTTPVKIAHHLHAPAQVIRAAKLRIPCIVLIRDPVDTIASLVIREMFVSVDTAFDEYICFYEHVLPYRKYFVLEEFDDIITDYGKVVDKVNMKFGTEFDLFRHSPGNVQKVFKKLDELEYVEDKGRVDEKKVARPSDFRKPLKNKVRQEINTAKYSFKLERAKKIFNNLIKTL